MQTEDQSLKPNPAWKIAITFAVIGFCWLSYVAIMGLVERWQEAIKMFDEMAI